MDSNNQVRKWKKYRLSKARFRTRIVNNGAKGVLVIGHVSAKAHLAKMLGRDVDHMKTMHTAFEWVFAEPLNG